MQRNVSPVNKLSSFINHGLITCTLLGIIICSKIEIPTRVLARDKLAFSCNVGQQTILLTEAHKLLLRSKSRYTGLPTSPKLARMNSEFFINLYESLHKGGGIRAMRGYSLANFSEFLAMTPYPIFLGGNMQGQYLASLKFYYS